MQENKNLNNEPKKEEKKKNRLATWWLNLKKPAKIGICAGGVVVLASAIIFPTLAATVWKKPSENIITLEMVDYKSKPFDFKASTTYSTTFDTKSKKYYDVHISDQAEESLIPIKNCLESWTITLNGGKLTNSGFDTDSLGGDFILFFDKDTHSSFEGVFVVNFKTKANIETVSNQVLGFSEQG